MLSVDEILAVTSSVRKKASAVIHPTANPNDVPADPETILAATEKLLAVNRGQVEPDERDSLAYRRVMTPDKLFSERVDLDAGKVFRMLLMRIKRSRNLKPLQINHFDPYTEGMVVGHQLSMPLEEINPVHLVEQQRRITQLGPGGIPSDSVTEESQSLHPSSFGYLDCISGPESSAIGVDTRAAHGTRIGDDGKIYQKYLNRRTNKRQWLSPSDLLHSTVGLPD